ASAAGAGAAAGADDGTEAGAPPTPSSTAINEPWLTLSPSAIFSSFTTPACDDGISIEALSLSTVMSDCSAFTVSPGFTSSSMTATSLKSPMSGTRIWLGPARAGAGAGAAARAGAGAGAAAAAGAGGGPGGGGAAAPSADSSTASNEPSLILSPSATFSSFTTPPC